MDSVAGPAPKRVRLGLRPGGSAHVLVLSKETPGVSTSAPPRLMTGSQGEGAGFRVEHGYALNPVGLLRLLQQKKTSVLIIDCRGAENFKKAQINHAGCYNVGAGDDGIATFEGFAMKSDVVKFFQEHSSSFLLRLQAPGHYSQVVVVDETSTVERCSKMAKLLVEGLTLWNDSTPTTVSLLQGGLQEFQKAYPSFVVSCENLEVPLEDDNPENPPPLPGTPPPGEHSNQEREVLSSLTAYQKRQDMVIGILRKLIKTRIELRTMEKIGEVLALELKEEEEQLGKVLETLIPEEVQCPICLELYSGEIIQCNNGHSVCGKCGGPLANCPECRAVYGYKVRNRALEKLLDCKLKIKCVCCGDEVLMKQWGAHPKPCVKKRNGEAFQRLAADMNETQQKIAKENAAFLQVKAEMLQTESQWNARISREECIANPEPELRKQIFDSLSARKMTMELLERELLSLIFGN